MNKVKLFTHTDLDGVGCYIVAEAFFGVGHVDVEYCDYSDVNQKVQEFLLSDSIENYQTVLITDISLDRETADIIDNLELDLEIKLLDHHSTALWMNENYHWAHVREFGTHGNKTSGTELTFDFLFNGFVTNTHLRKLVHDITMYDSWRWMTESDSPYMPSKKLNNLYYLIGRDEFINAMMNRKTINDFELLLQVEEKRIQSIIDNKKDEIKESALFDKNADLRYFGYVFSETNSSEIGNALCRENSHLEFIAVIDISKKLVSLRSIRDEKELHLGKDIASIYHGGGHAQASGCKLEGFWINLVGHHLTYGEE